MPVIVTKLSIKAPISRVFDLARSVELHEFSTKKSKEKAIAGKTTGLIGLGDWVTFRATHFGVPQNLTSKITAFEPPFYFADEMQKGIFKRFRHEHLFIEKEEGVLMKDLFDYESPLGILGKLADLIFLKAYMTSFLETRNEMIKEFAETEKWRQVLSPNRPNKY